MKAHIDFSVLTPSGSVGRVHGEMDFQIVPRNSELISFMFPRNGIPPPVVPSFAFQVAVQKVLHTPWMQSNQIGLALEDVVVATVPEALQVMQYFRDGFGLISEAFEDDA